MKVFSSVDGDFSYEDKEQSSSKRNLKDLFNVVSTQSTAKPGCVLYLSNLKGSKHVSL